MNEHPVRLALVNDYEVIVAGLASLLSDFEGRVQVVELDVERNPRQAVDIAIYDTYAAPNGPEAKGRINDLLANCNVGRVVAYSFNDEAHTAQEMLAAGASGYISKATPIATLVDALERIHGGEESLVLLAGPDDAHLMPTWPGRDDGLTARESEILAMITQGHSNDEIARACYLSINTVKSYVRSAYRKIGVATRAQAVAWAVAHGFRSRYSD